MNFNFSTARRLVSVGFLLVIAFKFLYLGGLGLGWRCRSWTLLVTDVITKGEGELPIVDWATFDVSVMIEVPGATTEVAGLKAEAVFLKWLQRTTASHFHFTMNIKGFKGFLLIAGECHEHKLSVIIAT